MRIGRRDLGRAPDPLSMEQKRVVGAAGQPAFQNTWQNFGGNFAGAAFWKDASGIVHVEGLITRPGGTAVARGQVFFALPVGYRPFSRLVFAQYAGDTESVYRVDVLFDGSIVAEDPRSINGAYVTLTGISFRASGF